MDQKKIQELKQSWADLALNVYGEYVFNDDKKRRDFHALVGETYYLFYGYVVEGNIPEELAEMIPLIRAVARLPRTSGIESINMFTVVTKALSDWIKLYSLDERYRKLEKGILVYYPEYILKKNHYYYYVGSDGSEELESMFDEIIKKVNKNGFLVIKHDIREMETRLEELLKDAYEEFSWKSFVTIAKRIAEILDGYNEYTGDLKGFMLQDSVYLPMLLYAYSHKDPHFEYTENGYGFNASKLIAYTLSEIAIGHLGKQKDGKYDPDNLVVYDEKGTIVGTIDTHTFDVSEEFIHYADFYQCENPYECEIDSIEVEELENLKGKNIIATDFYPYSNKSSSSYKIIIKSGSEIEEFWHDPCYGPPYTYQIKNNILYLGMCYDSDFAFAFMPKTGSNIKKIYLTNGKIDKLIWEKKPVPDGHF